MKSWLFIISVTRPPRRPRALLSGTVPRLSRAEGHDHPQNLACLVCGECVYDIGGLVGCRESKGHNQLSSLTFIKCAAGLVLKERSFEGR